MRKGFLLAAALLLAGTGTAVTASAAEGDIIVALKNASGKRTFNSLGLQFKANIADSLGIVLMTPNYSVLSTEKLLQLVRHNPHVRWAQMDHPVTMRETIPNDPDFASQWSLKSTPEADIGATFAWDLGRGGKNVKGDNIVVAVVDEGVDISHPSLQENIYVNHDEIAGNGIDDDGNGYIDDVNGWDAKLDSGTIPVGNHATHVAGIIGARGNDGSQISGINWDASIISIRVLGYGGSKSLTSTVLAGYGYLIKQKQLWLQSGGQHGANIVATNSSFGVDYGNCESGEYAAWNDIYNAMGEVGILSAAATINAGQNVDQIGDVPTGCSSPYLITVTNTTEAGVRNSSAGYGLTTIDLGAPGTNILSTVPSGIQRMTGTSMATPHVSGAIGFLHSVASQSFQDFYRQNPGEAALKLKDIILGTVTPEADLVGKTVSGGRLNLNKAATAVATF